MTASLLSYLMLPCKLVALWLLLLLCCCHRSGAFLPVGDDIGMDFLNNDTQAKADMDRMMLMNTNDPKLKAAAEEAFHEIMRAKRLTTLQECRRNCVVDHEEAAEFRRCNERCEASHKPGEYAELPTLQGEDTPRATAAAADKPPEPATPVPAKEEPGSASQGNEQGKASEASKEL